MLRNRFETVDRSRYLLYAILLFAVYFFRDFTPANELKYVSIADEALRNNHWFTFYNHGEIYADKPPLFFWLMMISRMLTGGFHLEVMCLFSVVPSIGVMLVMNRWMKEKHAAFQPVISELLLLTTSLFTGASLILRMDMLMTFFIVLSLYTFFRIYECKNRPYEKYMLPVYIFLGVFSKGAIGLLVPVVSIVVFLIVKRQIRMIGRFFGWRQCGVLIGLFAVWFVCVYLEGGKDYLNNLVFKQTVGRGVNSFHHKESFWFYFRRMFITFAPWTLLYIALIAQGIKKRAIRGNFRLFFATVIGSNIFVLSLVSAKLDIYMLPVYPFVIYLSSGLLSRFEKTWITRVAVLTLATVAVLIFPASFFVVDHIPYLYNDLSMIRIGMGCLGLSGVVAILCVRSGFVKRAIASIALGILGLFFLASFALPQFNKDLGFGQMAGQAKCKNPSRYIYYKFSTAANMDIYLGEPLIQATSLEELKSLISGERKTALFIRITECRREPELASWLERYLPIWDNGRYRCYLFDSAVPSPGQHVLTCP